MKRCKSCKIPLEGGLSTLLKKTMKISISKENPDLCNRCAGDSKKKTGSYVCQICNRNIEEASALSHIKAEEYLLGLIKKDHPEWKENKETCPECVSYYRELINKAKI